MSLEFTGPTFALTEGRPIGLHPTGHIVLLSQPPNFVFWEEWFHVGLTLRSLVDDHSVTGGVVELQAELIQGSTGDSSTTVGEYVMSVTDAAELVVEGERITIPLFDPADATGKENLTFVRCRIERKRTTMTGENAFLIRFSAIVESSTTLPSNMIVHTSLGKGPWTPAYTATMNMVTACLQIVAEDWPEVWYKDEGGRDKCMQVTVRLVDQHNQPVLSRCFQLHLTLVYDNDSRSAVMRQDKLRLLGPRKNYIDPETGSALLLFRIDDVSKNHQGLGFMIRVDAEPSIDDVAPAFSPSVSVRSKRNKRSREVMPIDVDSPPAAVDMSSFSFSPARSHGPAEISAAQHALKGVIEWSNAVVQGLHPLRWGVLGYTQLSDGSLDYNQPYHSMQNPNDFISKTAFMFNNEIQQHLLLLQSFFDSMNIQSGSPVGRNLTISRHLIPLTSGVTATSSSNHPSSYRIPLNQELIDPAQMRLSTTQQQYITPRSLSRVIQQSLPQQQAVTSILPAVTPMSINHKSPTQYLHEMDIRLETDAHKTDIHFVLAKLFKSIDTGKCLGFPAFNENKSLLGFYVESDRKLSSGTFVPLEHFDEFGPNEISHAKLILEQAMEKNSQAVHEIKNFESLPSMLDHALVYQWTKELQSEKEKSSTSHSFG